MRLWGCGQGAERLVHHIHRRLAAVCLGREPPLRVWREHRGLSQSALARGSGVNRVQIVEIEAGRNTGSVRTLGKLAGTLGITVDDLIPA